MDQWSEFNELSEMTFNNLRFGDYVFRVRSKIGNEFSLQSITFEFSIERPWYLSNFMIANYALFLGILFFVVNSYYNNFYRRKDEKMIKRNQSQLELKEIEQLNSKKTINLLIMLV